MSITAYPSTLPGPQPGAYTPPLRRAASSLPGPLQQRSRQWDLSGGQRTHTFIYTAEQMGAWRTWWRDTLLQGRRWFTLNLPGYEGMTPRVVRYLEVSQSLIGAGVYAVEARLELREANKVEPPPPPVVPSPVLLGYVERVLSSSVTSIQSAARDVPTGSHVIVYAAQNVTSPIVTISDTAGNTYTEANYFDGASPSGGWFYCLNATGSSTLRITASSNTSGRMAVLAFFFDGDTPLTYANTYGSAGGFDTAIGPFSQAGRSLTVAVFYTSTGLATVTLSPDIFEETYNLLTDSGNSSRGRFGYIIDEDGFSALTINATFDVGRTNSKAAAVFTY